MLPVEMRSEDAGKPTIAATVSSAFAAIIVGALTLNARPALAFGEEHLRMHIV